MKIFEFLKLESPKAWHIFSFGLGLFLVLSVVNFDHGRSNHGNHYLSKDLASKAHSNQQIMVG